MMQKQHAIWIGIIVAVLSTGLVLAQEQTESVESIFKELQGVPDAEATSTSAVPTPAGVEAKSAPVEEKPAPVVEEVEPAVVEPAEEVKKEEPKEETVLRERERFENPKERNIWRSPVPKERRMAEKAALDEVERSWNGMVLRSYDLSQDALRAMGTAEAAEAVDVTSEFPEIKFPKDAYAIYRPGLNRLFVQNTRANMDRFDNLLAALDAPRGENDGQVKIEARFVEFSEGALEELGFEWSSPDAIDLGGDWAIDDATAISTYGKQTLFGEAMRSVPFVQTGALGLGELTPGGDWGQVPNSGGWRANRMEDTFGTEAGEMSIRFNFNDQFDLLVRAMDQASGVDMLSAPSLVTLSGEEATITVGERHYYPEVYEEGVSDGTVIHIRYEDFYSKILGVEMKITPIIQGDEIQLEINPKITDLIGWEQFVTAPANSSHNYYQAIIRNQYEHEAVVAKLPIFKRRELKTEVSITSGSTVALGGLISEKLEAFDDRVPVLGSMPLIGRLFRSEGERTVKKNLTIFLTATKVEPNGRVVAGNSYE